MNITTKSTEKWEPFETLKPGDVFQLADLFGVSGRNFRYLYLAYGKGFVRLNDSELFQSTHSQSRSVRIFENIELVLS